PAPPYLADDPVVAQSLQHGLSSSRVAGIAPPSRTGAQPDFLIRMLRKWISAPSDCQPIGPSVSSLLPELAGTPLSLTETVPSAPQVISVVFHSPIGLRARFCAASSNFFSISLTWMK